MSDVTTDLTTSEGLAEHLDEVQIVDCREPYEWQAGRIESSIHIPLNSILAGAIGQLDDSRTTVVVCRSGSRSELATLMLRAQAGSRRSTSSAASRSGRPRVARCSLPTDSRAGSPERLRRQPERQRRYTGSRSAPSYVVAATSSTDKA